MNYYIDAKILYKYVNGNDGSQMASHQIFWPTTGWIEYLTSSQVDQHEQQSYIFAHKILGIAMMLY